MKSTLSFSIITPSFNQAEFINRTIQSVLDQRIDKFEYIIMDGGSTDGTLAILEKYGKIVTKDNGRGAGSGGHGTISIGQKNQELRTFFWVSKKDKGQADAINKGMRMAKGNIVGFLNSDDYYEPSALKKALEIFDRFPEVNWVTGDCRIVNEKGKEIQFLVRWYKTLLRHLPLFLVLPIINPIAQPSTFWRRSVMEKIGIFDKTLSFTFDYDYWLRLLKLGKPYILKDVLSSFRIHKSSKGGSQFNLQFQEEMVVARKKGVGKIPLLLHALHNTCIVWVYNLIK